MKKHIQQFLHFTKAERRGLIPFILFIACFFIIPKLPAYFSKRPEPQWTVFSAKLATLNQPKTIAKDTIPLFYFNPNTASQQELLKLGLPEFTVRTLVNYRSKGGYFKEPKDLQKLYNLSTEDFNRIESYIRIPQVKGPKPTFAKKSFPKAEVDINRGTVEDWKKLRGIGTYRAERIIKFRDRLGGFTNIDQVGETYGLPDSIFQRIKPQLVLKSPPSKLPINELTKEDLKAHPYISWKQAQVIVNYRNNHGPYQTMEDLEKVKVLDSLWIQRMEAYIRFE